MKTFEEAATIVLGIRKRDQRWSDEDMARLRSMQQEFKEDILNSLVFALVPGMCADIGMAVMNNTEDPFHVLPNVFINALACGVAIGVLMEKRED
jgi:hypothetical protein